MDGNRAIFGNTKSINSGTSTAFTIHLPNASGGAYLHRMKINAPGVDAATSVLAYNGTSGTSSYLIMGGQGTTIGSPVPLAAQPDNGFIFDEHKFCRTQISNGSLTIVVKGNTQASKNVYVAGEYTQ